MEACDWSAFNSRQWTSHLDGILPCLSSSSSSDPMSHILHHPATVIAFPLSNSPTHSALIPARTSQSICLTRSTPSCSRRRGAPCHKNQDEFTSTAKVSNVVSYCRERGALRRTSDEDPWVLQSTKKWNKSPRINVGAPEEDFILNRGMLIELLSRLSTRVHSKRCVFHFIFVFRSAHINLHRPLLHLPITHERLLAVTIPANHSSDTRRGLREMGNGKRRRFLPGRKRSGLERRRGVSGYEYWGV